MRLKYQEGLSNSEVGRRLGITATNVSATATDAKLRLREWGLLSQYERPIAKDCATSGPDRRGCPRISLQLSPEQVAAIDELPPRQRETMLLLYVERVTFAEAAARLNMTPRQLQSTSYKARKNLMRLGYEVGSVAA